MSDDLNPPILLFDGVCNLCAGAVQWIIVRNSRKNIKFASLQSQFGKALLQERGLSQTLNSLVLVEGNQVSQFSTGALRITRYLDGAWPLLLAALIVPAFIRDAVYTYVGRNRYKWFGQATECWLPTPELRARFLD